MRFLAIIIILASIDAHADPFGGDLSVRAACGERKVTPEYQRCIEDEAVALRKIAGYTYAAPDALWLCRDMLGKTSPYTTQERCVVNALARWRRSDPLIDRTDSMNYQISQIRALEQMEVLASKDPNRVARCLAKFRDRIKALACSKSGR